MKKYVVEFIGAFFLGLAFCMSMASATTVWAPLTVGLAYMVMIYAGGQISGAYYNPAVTLAIYLRGKLALGELPAYLFAQVVGGVVAALLSGFLVRSTGVDIRDPLVVQPGPVLLAEFAGAFFLCYVVLHMVASKRTMGNPFYGIVIGGTLTAVAFTFGAVSGGVFNPATAAGICTSQVLGWNSMWIYALAPLVAGAVAAFVFNYVNGPE